MKKLFAFFLVIALLVSFEAKAAIPAGTVWEVRSTGSDTNGGGWTAGATGTDLSQSNTATYSVTDGVTAGTTTITSATANFGTDIPGNVCYVAGGTGSVTAGWYQVASRTNATTIVMDRSTGLTAGTGVTIHCGGGLATPGAVAAVAVSGNKIYIKASATYQISAGLTFAGGRSGSSPFRVIGYTSTRGDGGYTTIQGITNTGLTLITFSGEAEMRNITVDCNSLGTCTGVNVGTNPGTFWNDKFKNYATTGIAGSNGILTVANCEFSGGTLSTGSAILPSNSSSGGYFVAYNNYIHDGAGMGINSRVSMMAVFNNLVANMSGASSDGIHVRASNYIVVSNTVYNSGRDGIQLDINNTPNGVVLNNILIGNGAYGLNYAGTAFAANPRYDGNAFYNNTTLARHGLDDTTTSSTNPNGINEYTNTKDVTLSSSPFNNAAVGDFALNNTGGGGGAVRKTGLVNSFVGYTSAGYKDFGAIQHQDGTQFQASYVFGE